MLDTLVLMISVFLLVAWFRNRPKNLPPGPWGWPIVGVLPRVGANPGKWYMELTRQYGDVISVRLGSELAVVIHGYDAVREAFVEKGSIFSGRPDNLHSKVHNGEVLVVRQADYACKMRRTLFKTGLRRLGSSKDDGFVDEQIREEIGHLCDALEKTRGRQIENFLEEVMSKVMANISSAIFLGERLDYDDAKLKLTHENGAQIQRTFKSAGLINCFPFLWRFPLAIKGELLAAIDVFHSKVREHVDAHKLSLDTSNPRDVLDVFLTKVAQLKDSTDAKKYIDDADLPGEFGDVVRTGGETTSTTLTWILLYMAKYPRIQSRVQEELDTFHPGTTFITHSERHKLPYTLASMHEVMRHQTVAPLGLPHATTEQVRFRGFDIPAKTTVFANLYSMHNDERYWAKPGEFKPERWLKDDGSFSMADFLATYSYGPRVCVGKDLAQKEVFMVFANLMKRFHFKPPEGKNDIDLREKCALISVPANCSLRAEPR